MHTQTGHRPAARPAARGRHGLPPWAWLVGRGLGALAILAVGAIHLQQYNQSYSAIPTIGTLFVVNFVAAMVIGVALLAPIEHLTRATRAGALVALVTAAGIALAGGSFVLLLVSERRPLFGFQEPGYDPTAIANAKATELAAVVLLAASLAARFSTRAPKARW